MSIPLDNFYQWVESCAGEPVTLYVFYPHGSKNILDFTPYRIMSPLHHITAPGIICHDQEPLRHELYNNIDIDAFLHRHLANEFDQRTIMKNLINGKTINLSILNTMYCNYYNRCILLHSENNSHQLDWYIENNYIPAYHWSHGTIARDWYRFAQHDQRLKVSSNPTYNFLVHSRDWSDKREYRLKFLELLHQNQLAEHCLISFKKTCSQGYHYSQHQFVNQQFKLKDAQSLEFIVETEISSSASADYDVDQIVNCAINVVLETVFDGPTIHHTEKICRALACGQPFILAAGPGSLAVLRRYGFKTFSPWIDESYDNETDSLTRLEKIVQAMKQFNSLSNQKQTYQAIKSIAEFNKKRFFSSEFEHQLESELCDNLQCAIEQTKKYVGSTMSKIKRLRKSLGLEMSNEGKQVLRKFNQWRRSQLIISQ
jgi:hypothetical protein